MSWLQSGYAVGDLSGPDFFLQGADLHDTVRETKSYFPHHSVYFTGDLATTQKDEALPNARRDPKKMPQVALKQSGLKRVACADVASLSYKDAHEILRPYFVELDGTPIKKYRIPSGMVNSFLTANAKLAKGIKKSKLPKGVRPGLSRGPNLLPNILAKDLSNYRLKMRGNGLCAGSNEACRETCLLYSGQNPLADVQHPIKLRRTEALLLEPAAWIRMFMEAIRWHISDCKSNGYVPYVRPNVLSDIPWELVYPEMFEAFPNLYWYDYTKVAGRRVPRNYDLTFSFSGDNEDLVEHELRRRRRVAVVFWRKSKKIELTDITFMGKRVIDGDQHDFRPLDPPGVIVGLAYKPVVKKGTLSQQYEPPETAGKFVVRAWRDPDTGMVIVAQTPATTAARRIFRGGTVVTKVA